MSVFDWLKHHLFPVDPSLSVDNDTLRPVIKKLAKKAATKRKGGKP